MSATPIKCAWPRCRQTEIDLVVYGMPMCKKHAHGSTRELHETFDINEDGCLCGYCPAPAADADVDDRQLVFPECGGAS